MGKIEFLRKSKNGRITLVADDIATVPVQSRWAVMEVENLEQAFQALRIREELSAKTWRNDIGVWLRKDPAPALFPAIPDWAQAPHHDWRQRRILADRHSALYGYRMTDQLDQNPAALDFLDYDFHWKQAEFQFALDRHTPGDETWLYAERHAQDGQALYVFDPLQELMLHAIETSKSLTNADAQNYMRYGAGRRLGMMAHAYREIYAIAPPAQENPLSHDDEQSISRDINILYLHTRGVLDNFAWSFLHETNAPKAERIVAEDKGRMKVDLFHPQFKQLCPAIATIEADINTHRDWNADVKARRDPVAHRIPLYVPPAVIAEEEEATYSALSQQHLDLAVAHDFEGSQAAVAKLDTLGKFRPVFMHDPAEGTIPIYPTVPTDMAHIIRISHTVFRQIRELKVEAT